MNDVEEIRNKVNVLDVVGARVKLKKAGHNYKGLCPFHGEKTPSFMVSPERGSWHCFGCGKGGSIFDFVMEYEHVDFPEALETLAEKAGVVLTKRAPQSKEEGLIQKIYEVNHLASEYYAYILTSHALGAKAREYLKERGATDALIKTFGLGYSPNSWDALSKFLHKKGYDDEVLEIAGLIVGGGRNYDRFRGRVMFSLRDHRGRVVGFSGRLLDKDAKEAKYINTSETPVYIKGNMLYGIDVTKTNIVKSGEIVVMEGEFDVISSFAEGISNVVAIKGSAFTEGHVHLIKRFCEKVVFALDADMAGDAASRRGIEIADAAGLELRVVHLPEGKDPDDLARSAPALLKKAIKDAVPLYDYLIDSTIKRYDITSAHGKRKVTDELMPWFAKLENQIVLSHYLKSLAKHLDVTEEVLVESLRQAKRPTYSKQAKSADIATEKAGTRVERMEYYILALLLQGKPAEWIEELLETVDIGDFASLPVRRVIEQLLVYKSQNPVFLMKDFADALPAELVPTLDEAFLWDLASTVESDDALTQEWARTLSDFRKIVIKHKLVVASSEMSRIEAEGGDTSSIEQELKKLSTSLALLEKSR